jgi:creatinine amidohydrolase/Fe(II)-dependent formamide hydrolase-like protein
MNSNIQSHSSKHVRLGDIVSSELSDILNSPAKKWGVLLPVGSLEQHGPLLPLNCDTAIAGRAAENLARSLMTENQQYGAYVLPDFAYTPSPGAEDTCGTISVSFDWMGKGIQEIIKGALRTPWDFVGLINGHAHNHGRVIEASMAGANGCLGRPVPVVVLNVYEFTDLALEFKLSPGSHSGEFEIALYNYYTGYRPKRDMVNWGAKKLKPRPPQIYGLDIMPRSDHGVISPSQPLIERALDQAVPLGRALDNALFQRLVSNLNTYFYEFHEGV